MSSASCWLAHFEVARSVHAKFFVRATVLTVAPLVCLLVDRHDFAVSHSSHTPNDFFKLRHLSCRPLSQTPQSTLVAFGVFQFSLVVMHGSRFCASFNSISFCGDVGCEF